MRRQRQVIVVAGAGDRPTIGLGESQPASYDFVTRSVAPKRLGKPHGVRAAAQFRPARTSYCITGFASPVDGAATAGNILEFHLS